MSQIRHFQFVVLAALLFAVTPASAGWLDDLEGALGDMQGSRQTVLTHSDIVAGLKDALRVSSREVVSRLSRIDGFNKDPKIHIPLPEKLQQVKSALSAVGMGSMMDDLELRLNRAAERATPKAKRIFMDAIREMTIKDARRILDGPDDAATQYFRAKMSRPLADEMRPVVRKALSEAGAVQAYDSVMGRYRGLPFVPDVKADLTQHVLDLGLAGIFHYMAEEEAAIRKNPVKRTTEILRKVFGD